MKPWSRLSADFDDQLVRALQNLIFSGASPEIDPLHFANQNGVDQATAIPLLEAVTALSFLDAVDIKICFVEGCNRPVDTNDFLENKCHVCGAEFDDEEHKLLSKRLYRIKNDVGLSRDIPWLFVVHGFNTRGSWQEDFSWLIANKLKYSAPVLIYKYGTLRFSVLFRSRHFALAKQLGERIRKAKEYARSQGIVEPPDLVIHSFGSRLFTVLLELKEFQDLNFGRIIVAGSIISPNFIWTKYISSGRISAVLNHRAEKDWAVPFAQYFIPGTGPSGKKGFVDLEAYSVSNPDYSHSSCFRSEELVANLAQEGQWSRFLTLPHSSLSKYFNDDAGQQFTVWKPMPAILGLVARLLILFILFCLGFSFLTFLMLGFITWSTLV